MAARDSERPPVVAHQRFAEQQEVFQDLDLKQRFERIYRTNLWGADTSVSGLGSEADATGVLRNELPRLLSKLGATSLLDAPCGDAAWINETKMNLDYVGLDIVYALVEGLQRRAAAGEIKGRYLLADITKDSIPKCDVILCRDCLVHLSFDNIARAVTNFRQSGAEWLITTTFPDWQANQDSEDGDWRALNLEQAPFFWPAPVELINENCLEAGGGWNDKSLGVWRLASIPQREL